jgi:hypothetical protein
MTLTRIVGDIHGNFNEYSFYNLGVGRYRHNTEPCPPEHSIQVGDFGIGFFTPYWHESVREWMRKNPGHRFIRGNHDDPDMCTTMPGYIHDGAVEDDKMFIGGAWSIDRAMRVEGKTWWPDEELSIHDLNKMVDLYRVVKPRVMFTHDCPTTISYDMFNLHTRTQYKTRTAEALQSMWEYHQPEMWFFGHWHETRDLTRHGTKFQCLGENEYMDVEI